MLFTVVLHFGDLFLDDRAILVMLEKGEKGRYQKVSLKLPIDPFYLSLINFLSASTAYMLWYPVELLSGII